MAISKMVGLCFDIFESLIQLESSESVGSIEQKAK